MRPLALASTALDDNVINDEPLSASLKELIDYNYPIQEKKQDVLLVLRKIAEIHGHV